MTKQQRRLDAQVSSIVNRAKSGMDALLITAREEIRAYADMESPSELKEHLRILSNAVEEIYLQSLYVLGKIHPKEVVEILKRIHAITVKTQEWEEENAGRPRKQHKQPIPLHTTLRVNPPQGLTFPK